MEIGKALRLLGLSPRASLGEAKSAYRRLAKVWHPDRHHARPDDALREAEEKMKRLNTAYGVVLRFLSHTTTAATTPEPRTPWWWREEQAPPPASARAIRRPPWFRDFAFKDGFRDDVGDYIGAIGLAILGLFMLGAAYERFTAPDGNWFQGSFCVFACFMYLRMAVEAIRD